MSERRKRDAKGWLESRHEPLISGPEFLRRMLNSIALGVLFVAIALGIGVLGYRITGHLDWLDALYNASMILSGMGPVDGRTEIPTAEKWFASFYAIFSGVAFLGIVGVVFAPVFHRFLHRFHVMQDEEE
jgi:hypothetical protein